MIGELLSCDFWYYNLIKLTSKKKVILIAWSQDLAYISRKINSFFLLKILYALFLALILFIIATIAFYYYYPHLFCTNLAIIWYILVLAYFRIDILHIRYKPL